MAEVPVLAALSAQAAKALAVSPPRVVAFTPVEDPAVPALVSVDSANQGAWLPLAMGRVSLGSEAEIWALPPEGGRASHGQAANVSEV